jgi:hypothetical protein
MEQLINAQGRRALLVAALGSALLLGACGGGGSDDDGATESPPVSDNGTVMIGLTDADGDFIRYAVTVESLSLERQDGNMVETMPASVTTDLAQFVNVSELFTSATVPQGTYTSAHLRINYSDADIAVEREGETVEAVVVDGNGDPLTTVDVEITLDNLANLVVRPGVPALMQIDFDLAASNTVDLTTTPITVTAEPFLLATVSPADGKIVYVAGQLNGADSSDTSYSVDLRPFHRRDGRFGDVTLQVTDATTYEIDGTPYTGADGLAALAEMPEGTVTLAEVTVDATDDELEAVTVLAGTSVPGASLDAVEGLVTARDGDVLHVRGATLVRESGDVSFSDDVEVTLNADVIVRQQGEPDALLDATAISVGQRIIAGGELSPESSTAATMTASNVRLMETHMSGTASTVESGVLVMDLEAVDARATDSFDFTGTGASPETDADPANYEIDTGSLSLSGIESGTPVRVFGFVAPFGAAPPDFSARSVADVSEASWRLDASWADGSSAAFSSLEAGGIVLDLSDPALGPLHTLRRGGVFTDMLTLPASPSIVASADGRGIYGIWQNGEVRMFLDFGRFVEALTNRMDGSTLVGRVHAVGDYDEGANTFAADRMAVILE